VAFHGQYMTVTVTVLATYTEDDNIWQKMNCSVVLASVTNQWCIAKQESRAAARKPRDAASVLFGRSSPTFLTSIRLAKLRKRPRFRAPNMLPQNTI